MDDDESEGDTPSTSEPGLGGILKEYAGATQKPRRTYCSTQTTVDFVGPIRGVTTLERRKAPRRPDAAIATIPLAQKRVTVLEEKIIGLTRYCFRQDSYTLDVNGARADSRTNGGNKVSIDVKVGEPYQAAGRIELELGQQFHRRLEGVSLFIKELARYIGNEREFKCAELIDVAYTRAPDLDAVASGKYTISFSLEKETATVAFRTGEEQGVLILE